MMPQLFGQPLYPYGFPMQTKQIQIGGKTVYDIYYAGIDGSGIVVYNEEEENILKEYVLYYLGAPVFRPPLFDLNMEEFKKLSLEDMIVKCFEFGIDPF